MKTKLTSIAIVLLCLGLTQAFSRTYYVHSLQGIDTNSGLSAEKPLKTLERVNQLKLQAGDTILLAGGMVYPGSLSLKNVTGNPGNPVVVAGYDSEGASTLAVPSITAEGFHNGILLENCSHILISNIQISANGGGMKDGRKSSDMRCGVLITTSKPGLYKNIVLKNLVVKDVYYEDPGFKRGADEVRTANGTQNYGWGIRIINQQKGAEMDGIRIDSCLVQNVAHTGIKFTAANRSVYNVQVTNCRVYQTGGPGMQFSGVENGFVSRNDINGSGSNDDPRKWGRGSGLWTWSCKEFVIEDNSFRNAKGPGDSAGCHIDFNCSDIIVQYNVSENNAGGFCEILGNNYNCAYRYNVSINDGYRVKKKDGAFQEGKIFWLSGFVGKGQERTGPYNSYFYNNTIYVKESIEAKVAVDRAAKGVLLVNNIFCIEGPGRMVLGDQYKPEEEGAIEIENVVFKNNLFLKKENWPAGMMIQDEHPLYGDPGFARPGGKNISDYVPSNLNLVKDRGIPVEMIPGDRKGLFPGLIVERDILGNKITGSQDMGAIEIN